MFRARPKTSHGAATSPYANRRSCRCCRGRDQAWPCRGTQGRTWKRVVGFPRIIWQWRMAFRALRGMSMRRATFPGMPGNSLRRRLAGSRSGILPGRVSAFPSPGRMPDRLPGTATDPYPGKARVPRGATTPARSRDTRCPCGTAGLPSRSCPRVRRPASAPPAPWCPGPPRTARGHRSSRPGRRR